ncbi:MAG: LysR substrate-binding domain-containing protein [Actinomycetota bacterium]
MTTFERDLPPLATLVAFEAAYRNGSFTRAAEELFTSQATVSRRVRELEADLGVPLFDRRRHDVTPTTAADDLVGSVRLSLSELSAAAGRVRRAGRDAGSLTVLASLSLTSSVVAPAIGNLQAAHPELNVRVVSSCEHIESTAEQFDVAVQYGPGRSARHEVVHIADETVYAVCAPSFAESLPGPVSVDAFASLPLLHVDSGDPSWLSWDDFVPGLPAVPDRPYVFSSYQLCLDVAEQGQGVALGWHRSVAPRIRAGSLVRIEGLPAQSGGSINAYVSKQRPRHPHVPELLDRIRAALAAG